MHASHPTTNDNLQGLDADAKVQALAQADAEGLVEDLALEPPKNLVSDDELHQLRDESRATVSDRTLRRLTGDDDPDQS